MVHLQTNFLFTFFSLLMSYIESFLDANNAISSAYREAVILYPLIIFLLFHELRADKMYPYLTPAPILKDHELILSTLIVRYTAFK